SGQLKNRALDVDRQMRARAERTRAADKVTGVLLRLREVARVHALDAEHARKLLGRDLSVAVHQDDKGLVRVRLHHQSLDDRVLVNAEGLRRVVRAAVLHVVVEARLERDLLLAQRAHGWCDRIIHNRNRVPSFKFKVQGSRFKVQGLKLGTWNLKLETYS